MDNVNFWKGRPRVPLTARWKSGKNNEKMTCFYGVNFRAVKVSPARGSVRRWTATTRGSREHRNLDCEMVCGGLCWSNSSHSHWTLKWVIFVKIDVIRAVNIIGDCRWVRGARRSRCFDRECLNLECEGVRRSTRWGHSWTGTRLPFYHPSSNINDLCSRNAHQRMTNLIWNRSFSAKHKPWWPFRTYVGQGVHRGTRNASPMVKDTIEPVQWEQNVTSP